MRANKAQGLIGLLLSVLFTMTQITAVQAATLPALVFDPSVCAAANDATVDGAVLTDDCVEMMAAFPRPVVTYVPEDRFTLSNYTFWRVGPDPVQQFDAPNGNVIGEIPRGFNFVTATDLTVEGWIQIQGGAWLRRSDTEYREPSYFKGIQILDGLKHPFAYVLDMSGIFVSEYPGGPASQATGRTLKRYEVVNIFAEAYDEDDWHWYMIGPNQWVKQTFLAVVKPVEKPEGAVGRWVAIDLYEQTLVAYEDDTPVYATLISSGMPGTDTREGLFTMWARLERDSMSGATGAPNAYALQMVPWVMYYDADIAIHGTYWHDLFGYRQSRGCINISVSDAKFLYRWFQDAELNEDGELVNYVYVHSSGVYGEGVLRQ